MIRILSLLILLLALPISCSHRLPSPDALPIPVPSPSPLPIPTPSPSPSLSQKVPHIDLGEITGAQGQELSMIQKGRDLVNRVIASDCFKSQVLNAHYTENQGLTSQQIYEKISSQPVKVNVEMYLGNWLANHRFHTIGYEIDPGTVYMNRYFVDTPEVVSQNLAHEGLGHSLGFTHDEIKSSSVPYGMNQAVEYCESVQK